ncbi:hypothetical protein HOY80DRAFT_1137469 [Tuber brumale]|nr:hypothetical protein HOY80DRAFT_1137469 [Tuber brumale]
MGNILTRAVPDPDIHTKLDAMVENLRGKQAVFEAHSKHISLLLTTLEEQAAKDLEFRQTMMEMLLTTRALKKRVQRMEAALKREKRRQEKLQMKVSNRTGSRLGAAIAKGKGEKVYMGQREEYEQQEASRSAGTLGISAKSEPPPCFASASQPQGKHHKPSSLAAMILLPGLCRKEGTSSIRQAILTMGRQLAVGGGEAEAPTT